MLRSILLRSVLALLLWCGPQLLLLESDVPEARERTAPPVAKAPFDQKRAKELQSAWATYLGRKVEETLDLGGNVRMEVVLIPPGTFVMGSSKEEQDRVLDDPDTKDIAGLDAWLRQEMEHEVTITRPFYIGKYAVTQQQYRSLADTNPSYFSAKSHGEAVVQGLDTSSFPVEWVSWRGAVSCCQELARHTGRKTTLPTEAEWEYACRAGTVTPYHFGRELNGTQANCDGNKPFGTAEKGPYLGRTCQVGSYQPNAFGLYDMHGNVCQWCQDIYGPYEGLPATDPVRAGEGKDTHVLRGGSWLGGAWHCRSARRGKDGAGNQRFGVVGFRVVLRLD